MWASVQPASWQTSMICKKDYVLYYSYMFVCMYIVSIMYVALLTMRFFHMCIYFRLHNIPGVFQRSQGNGPLNRLLVAAKRKYMDTELPPQESEGKVASDFKKPTVPISFSPSASKRTPPPTLKQQYLTFTRADFFFLVMLKVCSKVLISITFMLYCFFFHPVDLFQDLSQLQETWLTEGILAFSLYIISIAFAGN